MKKIIYAFLAFVITSNSAFCLSESEFIQPVKYETPKRKVAIIAGEQAYFPKELTAFVGEEVEFFVTSVTELPSCFILDGKNVFLSAKKGIVETGKVLFNQTGTYKFYCPSGKISGKITILERPDDKRERIRREIASEKKLRIWKPKEDEIWNE